MVLFVLALCGPVLSAMFGKAPTLAANAALGAYSLSATGLKFPVLFQANNVFG